MWEWSNETPLPFSVLSKKIMARRKTDNAVLNEVEEQQNTVNAEGNETANVTDTAQETPAGSEVSEERQKSEQAENVSATELPKYVEKILTGYPNYEELYIDGKGGVYVKGTQQNIVKDAILYKNPYYKQ